MVYGLVILNKKYEKTRVNGYPARGAYMDLDSIEGDKERVISIFKLLGITNIIELYDRDYDEIDDELLPELKKIYRESGKKLNNIQPTLVVIWYGGHGEMAGTA